MASYNRHNIKTPKGGFFIVKTMLIKYLLLALGLSSSLYSVSGVNTTRPVAPTLPIAETPVFETTKVMEVWVTAYSSTPEETDDTPFITASGGSVRSGIVATNLLPFGTKVQIPEVFGDRVFVVEDRMHSRKTNFIDIWMPTKEEAVEFGIAYTEILVLN